MTLQQLQAYLDVLLDDPIGFLQKQIYAIGLIRLLGYLVVVLLILWFMRIIRRFLGGRESRGTRRRGGSPREARRAYKQGDYLYAGELYEALGDYDAAARCYKEVRAYWNLGRLLEDQRKYDEAAQYFQLANDVDRALSLCQKSGNFVKAAELCVASKRAGMAAEFFEKGKMYKEAAIQYEKLGNLAKAMAMYERSNDMLKAASIGEKYFLQERGLKSGSANGNSKALGQIALQSGKHYLKASQPARAAEIFSTAGFDAEAGEAFLACGEKAKAAESFAKAKNFARAARLFQELGETQKGRRLLAEQFREERKLHQAAEAFEQAEEFFEAAEMYEQLENFQKAGEMFLSAGDFGRASEIFIHQGDHKAAAIALERGGRFQEAANLYIKCDEKEAAGHALAAAGDYYRACQLYQEIGKVEESIALLQRIEPDHDDYLDASLTLGQMLMDRGMVEAAKERYQKIIARQGPIGQKNLEVYYHLAQIHEKTKAFDEALSLYEKILAEDIHFKDVKAKSDLLKKALTTVKKALGSADKDKNQGMAQTPEGRYRIVKKLGQGGMGVVYQAEDTVLKRTVAYKILPPTLKEHPAVLTSFLQEARVAASLNHPNIVTIYDTGKNGDDLYITMEYVDGITLKESLDKTGKQPIGQLLGIMREICKGVAYAHSRQVIHRDIKPANVMLGKDGTVKIMDFGLAKVLSQSMADKTSVKGTPLYMSPEQILGKNVDHQSDIYSLGCSFYRIVANRPPFSQGDIYFHHLHTQAAPPKQFNTEIPDRLNQIILKAIEKEKNKRYKSVKDLLNDLKQVA